jgi:hypothetical protein
MFADSGIEYETAVYIADPQNGKLGVQSAMNRAIWRAFHENGISIPYPQREVRMLNRRRHWRMPHRIERFRASRSKSGKKRMSDPRDPVEYRVERGCRPTRQPHFQTTARLQRFVPRPGSCHLRRIAPAPESYRNR